MPTPISRIIVVDANPPWVRWLMEPLAGRVDVDFLRILPLPAYRQACPQPWTDAFRWRQLTPHLREQWVPVPGWTKFGGTSTTLVAGRIRRAIADAATTKGGGRCAVVYTSPVYSDVAERLQGRVPQAYFAHDPFRFYAGWSAQRVEKQEGQLFAACGAVAAISRQLAEDFQARTRLPVLHCPNAAARSFLGVAPPHPTDLGTITGSTVGCVGQINDSYDWELIEQTAALLPQATFIFIGPILGESPQVKQRIEAVLHGPNLRWLGPRDHAALPGYLHAFDVCWNPMRVNDHNNRRSPLRLYDYLTTDRPVLSTPLREVEVHNRLVATAGDAKATAAELSAMLGGQYPVDREARRSYLAANTWEERARQFIEFLETNLVG